MDLSTNEIALALSMIDAHHWRNGGSKIAAALVVAVNTAGDPRARGMLVPLGRRHVSATTGLEDRWTRVVLGELVVDGVLVVADEAAGSRGRCYRVNPDLGAWRVPWRGRISAELVAYRLAILSGRLQPTNGGVAARYSAPQTQLVAGYGTRQFRPSGAPSRATNGNGGGSHTAPQSLAAVARVPLSTDSSSTTRSTEEQEEEQKPSDLLQRIARAIRTRTNRPLYGTPLARLSSACDGLDEQQAARLEAHVAGLETSSFLTLVEGACQYADDLRAGVATRIASQSDEQLERTRAMLEEERAGPKAPPDFFEGLRAALRDDDTAPCDTGGA